MPPRKRKDVLITKQNRLIATRLMQISLLVDDYLYQQKPLSQRSAQAYINEILGYKEKCYQDVRSLQVIEKLTRCMKGIILEQQELHDIGQSEDDFLLPSQDILNTDNAMLSPVYSTADEDLTQITFVEIDDINELTHDNETNPDTNEKSDATQEIGEIVTDRSTCNKENEKESDKNKNVIENINAKTQTVEEKNPLDNDIMEVIDLCEIDDIIHECNARSHEQEFNIQKAISNLSIRDVEEAFTPFSQQYSQSILQTYPTHTNYIRNSQQKDITVPIIPDVTTSNTKDIFPKIVLPIKKKKVSAANKPISIENKTTQIAVDVPKEAKTVKPNTKKRTVKNINNKDPSEIVATKTVKEKKAKAKLMKTKPEKKEDNIKAGAKELKPDRTVQEFYATAVNQNVQSENHQAYNNKSPLTSKFQLSTEHTDNMKPNNQYKEALPIYNSAVINDLSWIENIRFVREITSEEYENIPLNDIFWENYTLPDSWNVNDFNY